MIPFAVIMADKLRDRAAKMTLTEGNQSVETLFFDRADEALGKGIGIWRPIRRLNDTESRVLQTCAHRFTPLRIPVADQHATRLAIGDRERAPHLTHEDVVRMRRRPENLNPPRGEVNHKDRVDRDQPAPRPHLGREEIRGGDRTPMSPQERLSRCRTLWYGRNAARPQNPRDRRPPDLVPEILQRTLDPRVPSSRILLRHPPDQLANLGEDAAPACGLLGVGPFPGDELPDASGATCLV